MRRAARMTMFSLGRSRTSLPRSPVACCLSPVASSHRLAAFSLVEMMIAIVILGLGLIMVATMFPVAWDRARTLSEFTVEQTITANVRTDLAAMLRPSSVVRAYEDRGRFYLQPRTLPASPALVLGGGDFAGDLFYDPTVSTLSFRMDYPARQHLAVISYSDTRVHALNMQNMLAVPKGATNEFVAEDSWKLERVSAPFCTQTSFSHLLDPTVDVSVVEDFAAKSFCTPRLSLNQRLHPPLPPMPDVPGAELDQWNERLSSRRFCTAILHRLRSHVGTPQPTLAPNAAQSEYIAMQAAAAISGPRTFDIYYVMLRRPQSTNRYARQADDQPDSLPDPYNRSHVTFAGPRPVEEDVAFPVPWRIQVEFVDSAANRMTSRIDPARAKALGVPTEITVPPEKIRSAQVASVYFQMFQAGSRFIDEASGALYRVTKQRVVSETEAVLTLDREIPAEEIDDGEVHWVPGQNPPQIQLEDDELIRTVWVFPPAIEGRDGTTPIFSGPSPVVDIQVGSLTLSPTN